MKNTPALNYHKAFKPAYSNLYYMQSRGIFWNEKKGFNTAQEAERTQQKEEQRTDTDETTDEDKATQKEEPAQAKKAEAPKKAQTAKKPETFDALLEDPTPENKKKLHALWVKMEQDIEQRAKSLKETKALLNSLEKAASDHNQKISDLRDRLKEEIEERELMRKRFDKELEQSKSYAITKFAKDIIEVPDNLERALESAKGLEGKSDNLYEGVKITNSILTKALAKHGVTQINPIGEKFDPNFHEALFDVVDAKKTPGTVGFVASTGYIINDRVLRPAKVGVIKPPEKIEDQHDSQ